MRDFVKTIMKKYRAQIVYLVFGVLTTLVSYLVYFPCYHYLKSAAVSNAIAWVIAVSFAYLTNKPFVFGSHDWSWRVVGPEVTKFVLTRVASGAMETGMLYLAVDLLGWNGDWCKIIASVFVVIVNYVGSKLLVFRNQKEGD